MEKIEETEKKVVDTDDVDTLKRVYGNDVSSYLSESDITKKKTKTGAFLISNNEHFQQCEQRYKAHLDISREKKETKIVETPEEPPGQCYNLPADFQVIDNDDQPFENQKKPFDMAKKAPLKCETQSAAIVTVDDISFEESFKNHIDWLTISKEEPRGVPTEWDYDAMFSLMMNSSKNLVDATKYKSCLEVIKPILMKFYRQHKKFKYVAKLKSILMSNKLKDKKTPSSVSLHVFMTYISEICARVIPVALFGNNRNEKKARRVLKEYYLAPFGEKICFNSFLQRVNITCVTWLRPIEDEATRWSVYAEVSKWMFEYYFSVVLKSVFLIRNPPGSNQKQFLLHENWTTDRRKYIQDMKKNETIVQIPDSNIPKSKPPGYLAVVPDPQTGIRPIYSSLMTKNSAESKELELLKTLLHQLYYEKHEYTSVTDLRRILKSRINQYDEQNEYRWRVVAFDIQDAFGSINQAKLFDIVNGMINEIPHDTMVTKWYAVLSRPEVGTEPEVYYTQGFTGFSEPAILRKVSLITPMDGPEFPPETMEKETARTCIKNFIFNQKFQLDEKVYSLKQGVLEGFPLSPILSEIYYGTLKDQAFHSFIQSNTLFRFADSFLFISENNDTAKKLLEFISNRIPEYDCCVEKSTIQSNVRSSFCKETKSITYLGYRIDGKTLDTLPEFEGKSDCYSPKVPPTLSNPIEWFSQEVKKIRFPKLNGIVLSAIGNKVDALATNAREAGYTMASRCAVLIPAIFQEISCGMKIKIMKEIESAVVMLALIYTRHLDEKSKYATARIRVSIWKAFSEVFAKYGNLRRSFCKDIKHKLEFSKRW